MLVPDEVDRSSLRWGLIVVGTLVAFTPAAWATGWLLQQAHVDEVLAGTTVDGHPVGGLDRTELTTAVHAMAEQRLEQPVRIVAADERLVTDRAAIGVRVDHEQAVEQAWSLGRRGVWRGLSDQIRSRLGAELSVALDTRLAETDVAPWAREAATQLSREPEAHDLTLERTGTDIDVDVRAPRPGQEVMEDDLLSAAASLRERPRTTAIDVPTSRLAPLTSAAEAGHIEQELRRAVSAPVRLINPSPGEDLILTPFDLADLLDVEVVERAPAGERLAVTLPTARLRVHLGTDLPQRFGADPVDASLEIEDGTVEIVGGTSGFAFDEGRDVPAVAQRVLNLTTTSGTREAELPGIVRQPVTTREDVQALGITEQVSSFTTDLVPGRPRTSNIQLGAEQLDGTRIAPGDRLSLNEAIGPRTRDRGYVEDGFIRDGELETAVGGGISQMGTTFMNAAWFAGIRLTDFQPHSFYFQRYPVGREATLSWGTVDVVVENDSPYHIHIEAHADDRSVTVSFYSTRWAEVETWTGERSNHQPGGGFDISFGRTITYPDGSQANETYSHRYSSPP